MRKRWFFIAPLALLAMFGFALLFGEVVKLLWNWLLPSLFGWPAITFWQAFGILALCRILFGRFGSRFPNREHWRHRMRERWQHMTPEERERMRQRWGGRCGWTPPAESTGQAKT